MKASLIWDRVDPKPDVAPVLLNKMPHVQFLPVTSGVSQGLRQLDREKPELVFFASDLQRPEYSAMIRSIRARDPGCYIISFRPSFGRADAPHDASDLTLPAMWSEKQLLDGVFLAELRRSGAAPEPAAEQGPEQTLPDPKAFLDELDQSLYKFPDQVQERHWQRLEQWMDRDADAVGWHLVSLTTMIAERLRKEDSCPPELEPMYSECLRVLAGGPSVPLWKGGFNKMCTLYISQMLSGGDPAGRQILRIRQYIDEHVEEDVSLTRVAQEFFLSTSYLSRLFKSKVGMNFSDYIANRKVERAKSLLTDTDLTVAEIARKLNYPEQNSFSRFFKNKVGIPPLTYRAMNTSAPKERAAAPDPVLEDFEITDFGPCAFTSDDPSFAYSFHKRR